MLSSSGLRTLGEGEDFSFYYLNGGFLAVVGLLNLDAIGFIITIMINKYENKFDDFC